MEKRYILANGVIKQGCVSALYAGWRCENQLPLFEQKDEDDGMDRTPHQPER